MVPAVAGAVLAVAGAASTPQPRSSSSSSSGASVGGGADGSSGGDASGSDPSAGRRRGGEGGTAQRDRGESESEARVQWEIWGNDAVPTSSTRAQRGAWLRLPTKSWRGAERAASPSRGTRSIAGRRRGRKRKRLSTEGSRDTLQGHALNMPLGFLRLSLAFSKFLDFLGSN